VLKYVLIALALLWVLPALLIGMGGAAPFAVLLALAILAFFMRGRWRGSSRAWFAAELSVGTDRRAVLDVQPLPELGPSHADRLLAAVERLEDRRNALAPALPEDPLDNDHLVQIMGALVNEPAAERDRVEAEYRDHVTQFAAWAENLARLRRRLPRFEAGTLGGQADDDEAELERLGAVAASLEAYVDGLAGRSKRAQALPDEALEAATRAGEALEEARASYEKLGAGSAPELDAADEKLRRAWDALEKGHERPETAEKLAAEVEATAAAAEKRLSLPDEIVKRRSQVETTSAGLERELQALAERFRAAALVHAPSSWRELEGIQQMVGEELELAWELSPAGADDEETAERLEQASAALARGQALARRIAAQLDALERAALEARNEVEEAERAIDRAWASAADRGTSREARLRRAGELVQQARAELERDKPDWLEVSALAERSAKLAAETGYS
jgi:hypothetical protein